MWGNGADGPLPDHKCSRSAERLGGTRERVLFPRNRVLNWPYFFLKSFHSSCPTCEKNRIPQNYQKIGLDIGWEWVFVAGIVPGSLLSAITCRQFETAMTPEMWTSAFGDGGSLRWLAAFIGGMIMTIGARRAGGVITAFLLYVGA